MKLSSKTMSFLFVAVMTASSLAMAQDPPPIDGTQPAPPPPPATSSGGMGSPGQFAIAADLPFQNSGPLFAIVRQSQSDVMGVSLPSSTVIGLVPSADYFVAPNISVGGQVGYVSGSSSFMGQSADAWAFAIIPRVGLSMMLTDVISFWARLGIGYAYTSSSSSAGADSSGYIIPLIIEAPVLWHPAPHFFLGAGPMFTTELVNKQEDVDQSKETNFGVTTMIGGYFGGT
jgi:hypothetical protein